MAGSFAGCGWRSSASCDSHKSGACCLELAPSWAAVGAAWSTLHTAALRFCVTYSGRGHAAYSCLWLGRHVTPMASGTYRQWCDNRDTAAFVCTCALVQTERGDDGLCERWQLAGEILLLTLLHRSALHSRLWFGCLAAVLPPSRYEGRGAPVSRQPSSCLGWCHVPPCGGRCALFVREGSVPLGCRALETSSCMGLSTVSCHLWRLCVSSL